MYTQIDCLVIPDITSVSHSNSNTDAKSNAENDEAAGSILIAAHSSIEAVKEQK